MLYRGKHARAREIYSKRGYKWEKSDEKHVQRREKKSKTLVCKKYEYTILPIPKQHRSIMARERLIGSAGRP